MNDYNESSSAGVRPRTVKDFAIEDQPREKAAKYGCSVLTLSELWALVLRTGLPGKPVTDMSRELMEDSAGSLHNLERKTRRQLMLTKGIGTTKAVQIEAVMELIRRYNGESAADLPTVRNSADIARIMRPRIGNSDHEELWAMYVSRSGKVIKTARTSSGSAVATVFDLKSILKEALLENAEGLALIHNHPSGALEPSVNDDNITRDCSRACKAMQLRFLDHVIVTAHGHYSFADKGKLG